MGKKRVGRAMQRALDVLEAMGGFSPTKYAVASRVHPACANGNNCKLGYDPVNRCIRDGLIVEAYLSSGRSELRLPGVS